MKFNPDKHRRRSIRLKGYDYSRPGYYFVTICTNEKECLFGEIINGVMELNEYGEIAKKYFSCLSIKYQQINIADFVIMPNHVHGIINIIDQNKKNNIDVRVIHELPLQSMKYPSNNQKKLRNMLLPKCIGFFKMNVARDINLVRKTPGSRLWQRNYYEHIIRDKEDLNQIRKYIEDNPFCWKDDENNPDNIKTESFKP